MDLLIAAALGVLGGAVAGGVIATWQLRGVARDEDVDELVKAVELQVREQRRERMRSVRRGEKETDLAPPKELIESPVPAPVLTPKEALRRRVFSMIKPGGLNVAAEVNREGDR